MIINLFSYNNETSTPDQLFSFNQVVAWSLHRAFEKVGVKTRFVDDGQFWEGDIPEADHSIIISGFVMSIMRDNPLFHQKVRQATTGKMTLYLDADYGGWWKIFDHVFTIIRPTRPQTQYVYAGWGADPDIFFPSQDEKAIFIDSLMHGKYDSQFDNIYNDIMDVFHISKEHLKGTKPIIHKTPGRGVEKQLKGTTPLIHRTNVDGMEITVYLPVPCYRENVIPWSDFRNIQRKCHFYLCTQLGEAKLTRIESATCGSLLVVPKPFLRPRTMGSLKHVVYKNKQELIEILKTKTKPEKIREKALEHSWDRVVERMLPYFGG